MWVMPGQSICKFDWKPTGHEMEKLCAFRQKLKIQIVDVMYNILAIFQNDFFT